MNTICLNMIVKNESKIIERLFDSVSSIIDSYCICDTGSTDNTVEIIKQYFAKKNIPGKVVYEPFKNFSHNRNFALNACFGMSEYILLLDADMILQINKFDKSRFFENPFDEYKLLQGNEHHHYPNTRMVRNNGKFKYHCVTHEYISGEQPIKGCNLSKEILFIIDIGDGGAKSDKFERDIALLKKGIEDEPKNTRYYFYLGNSYLDSNKNDEAIETYTKLLKMDGWSQEKYCACLKTYEAYLRKKEEHNGIFYLIHSYKYEKKRIETIYRLVKFYCMNDLNDIAYSFYSLIQDYFENEFLPKNDDKDIFVKYKEDVSYNLFTILVEYKFYLPYYMIIVSEKTRRYEIGIRMYEILFELQYIDAGEWWINNLIFNLQFFIYKVPKDKLNFFSKYEKYYNLIKKYNMNHNNLIDEYQNYINKEIYNIVNINTPLSIINTKENILENNVCEIIKTNKIPNIIHYCFGLKPQTEPFLYVYYLSILSATIINKPEKIYFYYHYEPYGKWWDMIKNSLELEHTLLPLKIGAKNINKIAHMADIIRINKLYERGGIYFDIDTISYNSYHSLLDNDCVMGEEGNYGLCNAIMLSKPKSEFLKLWIDQYEKYFKPDGWNEASVLLPKLLADDNPNLITVVGEECFFQPTFRYVDDIFKNNRNINKNLITLHLWESISINYIMTINEEWIKNNSNTLYAKLVNKILIKEECNKTMESLFTEDDPIHIECPNGYFININSAKYDKLDVTLEVRYLVMKNNNKFLNIKEKYNDIFGDPLWGRLKYLTINYNFINEKILDYYEKIPKLIFQTKKENVDESINNIIEDMVKKNLSDEWKYEIFSNEQQLNYLKSNNLKDFPNIIDKYNSYTNEYKNELFKYYYLFINGGVYLDNNIIIYDKIDNIIKDYSFIGSLSFNKTFISSHLVACYPKHELIYSTLKNIYSLNENNKVFNNNLYITIKEFNDYNIKLYKEVEDEIDLSTKIVNNEDKTILLYNPDKIVDILKKECLENNKFKICVIMFYDDNIKSYGEINYNINKLYCEKYNFDIILSKEKKYTNRHSAWERLPLLLENISKYDYLIWIDADAFFYNDSNNIEDIINKNRNINFIFSKDIGNNNINTGIFIVKNSEYSIKFLTKWVDEELYRINPYPGWWDQGLLIYMFKQNILDIENNSIQYDYGLLQHFFNNDKLENTTYIYHLAGRSENIRYTESKIYFEKMILNKIEKELSNFNTINKIIIIDDVLLNFITKNHYIFCKNLEKYGWEIILLSKLDINEIKKTKAIVLCVTFEGLNLSLLKCDNLTLLYWIEDLFPFVDIRNNCINECDVICGSYAYLFSELKNIYTNIMNKPNYLMVHSVINEYFENLKYNNDPIKKILISGYVNETYPFRQLMYTLATKNNNIEIFPHPNYSINDRLHNCINEEYLIKLNQYLCCFTCALKWKYMVIKVFEITAAGSLLLVDDSIKTQLNEQGFIDKINCIMCNIDNIQEKIDWILDVNNLNEVNRIRNEGMLLTREKHNSQERAKKFNNYVENSVIINVKSKNEIINEIDFERKNAFENIYKNNIWNNNDKNVPLSGPGSSLEYTQNIANNLNNFIMNNKCKSILDLGCGDLTWISKTKFFNDNNIEYTGIDIVEFLINNNKNKFPHKNFINHDIVNYKGNKKYSIIIIRDVIFHLKMQEVEKIFSNLYNNFEYLFITSNNNSINNDDFDKWKFSPRNINIAPFNISQKYISSISEIGWDRKILIYTHDNFFNKENKIDYVY